MTPTKTPTSSLLGSPHLCRLAVVNLFYPIDCSNRTARYASLVPKCGQNLENVFW